MTHARVLTSSRFPRRRKADKNTWRVAPAGLDSFPRATRLILEQLESLSRVCLQVEGFLGVHIDS
jgi:hypothetical protein